MIQQIGYVATLPTIAFPQYLQSFYGRGGCASGVITLFHINTLNQGPDGSYYCSGETQCTSKLSGFISTCPVPTGTLATGYAQSSYFNNVSCTAANIDPNPGTQFYKLGACDPGTSQTYPGQNYPNRWSSSMITGYTSAGGTTVFVQTSYQTTNCGGIAQNYRRYYPAGYCPATWSMSYSFSQYSLVSTLPTAPVGSISEFDYANAAACAATDSTQIVRATYSTSGKVLPANYTQTTKCYNPYPQGNPGPALTRTFCGPQTFTSTTGGFIVLKYYADSACATTPTGISFYQPNICMVSNVTSSYKIASTIANGVTVASYAFYRTTACTGTPSKTYNNIANTTEICVPSGSNNGVTNKWATVTFASVVGISSGSIQADYSTASSCTAQTQASLFSGYQGSPYTCGERNNRNNSLTVVNVCGAPTAAVAQVIYATQTVSSATLTLTTVQSPAFQKTFKQAVATTAGVAVSAVEVNHHPTHVLSPIKP